MYARPLVVALVALSLFAPAARAAEPHVVSTSPVRLSFAPPATAVSITFDQALLQSSVTHASLRVFGRASGTKTGTFTFSNSGQTVTLTPTKLKYKNRDGSASGTKSILFKEGLTDGEAQIVWKAKGGKLVMPDLGAITGPIDVQMQRSGGAPCFGATYSAPFTKSDATIFKDKAD